MYETAVEVDEVRSLQLGLALGRAASDLKEDAGFELAVQIELELGSTVAEEVLARARTVLAEHPGASPVWLQVGEDNGERAPRLRSRSLRVTPDAPTMEALQKLFGRGNVRLVRTVRPDLETIERGRRPAWVS